jgi:membrane protease YdiL (CAAX protease family)
LAAIVTGIFFGAVHATSASPQYLVPLGFLGFVLCLVRWRTGSLYPCMALHSFNNSLALGVNALHWTVGPIVALIVGSLAVIGFISGPLGASTPSISPAKPHRPSG